jgi:hypothetical protein
MRWLGGEMVRFVMVGNLRVFVHDKSERLTKVTPDEDPTHLALRVRSGWIITLGAVFCATLTACVERVIDE